MAYKESGYSKDDYNRDPKTLETVDEVFTTIKMSKGKSNVIVLVEGNIDFVFYSSILLAGQDEECVVYPVKDSDNTKGKIIQIIKAVNGSFLAPTEEDVIGIVDSDYWGLDENPLVIRNLFKTDTHDVETMLMSGPLERWVKSFDTYVKIDRSKITCRVQEPGLLGIVELIVKQAYELGLIRYSLERLGHHRTRALVDATDDFDPYNIFMSEKDFIRKVSEHLSPDTKPSIYIEDDIYFKKCELESRKFPVWNVINGHDMEDLLHKTIKTLSSDEKGLPRKKIQRIILETFLYQDVKKLFLWNSLNRWRGKKGHEITVMDDDLYNKKIRNAISDRYSQ